MADIVGPGSWNVDMEVNLFHAMRGHKPVGVNRHFQMVFIHEKLNNASGKKITSKNIWEHLSSMYDLQALNESEILPFPNKPLDFQLNSEFQEIIEKEYPRMQNTEGQSAPEEAKPNPEGQAKGGKSSKSDVRPTNMTRPETKPSCAAPTDSKPSQSGKSGSAPGDTKSSSIAKLESKAVITPSNKGELKSVGKSAQNSGVALVPSAPEPSPKRTKRTRTNVSASNSPLTPDGPLSKRRR